MNWNDHSRLQGQHAFLGASIKAKVQAQGLDYKKDKKEIKKIAAVEMQRARDSVGASGSKTKITFTDREWEAVQAGAISDSKLMKILNSSKSDEIIKRAMPKASTTLSSANGDIDAMSIYANGIQKAGRTVMHGMIKELSLVIAGCNPGALIDEVVKHSADGSETDSSEAYIYTDSGLSLKHGLDPDDNPLEDETLQHSDDSSETDKDKKGESKMADANEKTVKEVFDTLTEEQKNVVYAIIGSALDEGKGGESNDKGDGEEDNTMHHCFENDNGGTVLKHSLDDINGIIATASKHGTLRDAFLDAGITSRM